MYKHKINEKRIISEDVTTYLSISFLTYRILYLKTKAQIGDYGFFFAQVLSGFFTKEVTLFLNFIIRHFIRLSLHLFVVR